MLLSIVYIQIFVVLQILNYMQTVNLVLYTNKLQCLSHPGCAVAILHLSGLLDQLWKIYKQPLGKSENTIWLFKAFSTFFELPTRQNAASEAEDHCATVSKLNAPQRSFAFLLVPWIIYPKWVVWGPFLPPNPVTGLGRVWKPALRKEEGLQWW